MKIKNNIIFLEGKNVFLRPFLRKDINKKYLKHINSKINFFLETGKIPINEIDLINYYNENKKSKNSILFAAINKNGAHIGNCSISNIDWINRRCTYGRLIWNEKKTNGLGSEILKLLQSYIFNTLNLNSMYTGVVSENTASIKSNLKCGMKIAGKYEESFFRDNRYYDTILFSLTKKQYIKINAKKNIKK